MPSVKFSSTEMVRKLPLRAEDSKLKFPCSVWRDTVTRGLAAYVLKRDDGTLGRSYAVSYWARGKRKSVKLGDVANLDLPKARDAAKRLLAEAELARAVGAVDPITRQQAEDEARRNAGTVEELAGQFLANGKTREGGVWTAKTKKNYSWFINEEIVPRFGKLKPDDVTKREVRAFLEQVADRAPGSANRCFEILRRFYAWMLEREIVDKSPCAGLKRPTPAVRRERLLSPEEIRHLWTTLDAKPGPSAFVPKLILLTACRPGEVFGMRWDQISKEGKDTYLTLGTTKNKKPHRVVLSPQALDVLAQLKVLTGNGTWCFPSIKYPDRAMADWSVTIHRVRQLTKFEDFRFHDCRRTAATIVSSIFGAGRGSFLAGLLLNHVDSSVTGIYDRAEHRDDMRAAWLQLGERIEAILTNKQEGWKKVVRFVKA